MINNDLLSVDNGVDKIVDADATTVAKEYYTSYSKYVLEYRALPSVYDGLKPVQRRIIYTANQFPQKLMKTAKLSGAVLAYHPHGSASITGAINDMAHPLNVLTLFTTKGNFGGVGFGASADRYTECYLSEIARMNFCQFVDYADYEIGEIGEKEPVALPCLIPYALFKGSEGIGVGLSTKIMPLNLIDLIDYYIDYIKNDGKSSKLIKPDVGCVLIENDESAIKDEVFNYRGKITVSSIVNQISSNTFLLEGLFDRSVDAVINKIDKSTKWFTDDKVGFRDASTSSIKYIFEIYDSSVQPNELKDYLVWATRRSGTFTRVVEEDGNAIYSSLNYVISKSLECLNKAINKWINSELSRSKSQLDIYSVLRKCKSGNIFDQIANITTDQLVFNICNFSGCSEETAREIVKKPISYLTRSHDNEEQSLINKIADLENHDRKKYLIKLYKDFRKAVLPVYESKKHSITTGMLLKNPCIKLDGSEFTVTDGDGVQFDSIVYFISDKGFIYKRSVNTSSSSSLIVETTNNDKIVGFVTDKSKYIVITTKFNYDGWKGKSVYDISSIKYDKRYVNLREGDDIEIIESVEGLDSLSEDLYKAIKGSKLSKTTYFKV